MRKPAVAGLFDGFNLWQHLAKDAALVAVITNILIGHRATRFAAILDECTGHSRHDRAAAAAIALDHAIRSSHFADSLPDLLFRVWRRIRYGFECDHRQIMARAASLFLRLFWI